MKLSDFDFNLPKELIAQKPVRLRDHSKLLILDKKTGQLKHDRFYNLLKHLSKNDVLVFNNTKVFPARLMGKREETGGKVEVFLLQRRLKTEDRRLKTNDLKLPKGECWEVLIGNKRKKLGQKIFFTKELFCEIIKKVDESVWLVKFNKTGQALEKFIDRFGQVPLPPYIKNESQRSKVKSQYQTVYAKYRGSVAAPTAGFHFTKELLNKIKKAGIQTEFVTLHVGLGTFQPVKEVNILKHKMHSEWASLDKQTAERLNKAKVQGKRIIAVGTTTVRVLETFAAANLLASGERRTDIFIYPGYKFKFVDAMVTNFHLPKSTLLMLISSLAGINKILEAYQEAIKKKYRFYSFGDAMFIN